MKLHTINQIHRKTRLLRHLLENILYLIQQEVTAFFRIIHEHKVNAIFTVPTSFRVLKREDPCVSYGRSYSIKSLKRIFVAGEHCDYETKSWTERVFKVPVLNHWWQTETGHAITATCVGLGNSLYPPKYAAGMPFPGYNGK